MRPEKDQKLKFLQDEEIYQNICNITTFNKWLKRNITISRVKGSSSSNPKQKGHEEEVARKEKEETTRC